MRRASAWIGCALCMCASLVVCAQDHSEDDQMRQDRVGEDEFEFETGADPTVEVIMCNKVAWRIPGQYIVVLHPGTHQSQVQKSIRRLRARAARRGVPLEILQTFSGSLQGFLLKITSDALFLVKKLPHVHYIEEDSSIFAQSVPWNLQSLLRPHGSFSDAASYRPLNDGGGAELYLMDGGVQSSHREIEGRVLITDFNNVPEEDGVGVHRQASQCDSHGTHMAGVVSGHDSGVAPGVGVNLVRVLNCQGKGSVSGALAGLEYIAAALPSRPEAVVVLLPFTGGFSRSLNAACAAMVSSGAVLITSAGNYRDDACLYSPSSEPEVITVGAVTSANQLVSQGAGGTNFGRCVDFFAPGDDIISASSDCSTCFTSRSGTSQAAAHAAGVASVFLTSQMMSPVQLLHTMLRYSTYNMINFLPLSDTHQLTTANLVAAMPDAINTSLSEDLLCRWVWSHQSGTASSSSTSSHCRQGEEMMGCSSYAPGGAGVGETITEHSGQMECVAYNGPAGRGVFAVARCCVISGLRCRGHVSVQPGKDAECGGAQHHLTGCTSWFTSATQSDSHPKHSPHKGCTVRVGVTSHAVCCHAPNLECHTLESKSTDKQQVELSCPDGWTLTDCNAISQGSAVLGPVTRGNSCHIHGGDGAVGVIVCCRVRPNE